MHLPWDETLNSALLDGKCEYIQIHCIKIGYFKIPSFSFNIKKHALWEAPSHLCSLKGNLLVLVQLNFISKLWFFISTLQLINR